MTFSHGRTETADKGSGMRAMVLREYDKALLCENVSEPTAGQGEVVVKVAACGMCFTDVKIVTGQLASFVTLPHIPGHEIAGEIVSVGRGTPGLRVGDKGVAQFILSCGHCEYCQTGRDNLCFGIRRLGFEENGGYAEYVAMPATNFIPYHAAVDPAVMAVIPDAVATPYHALTYMVNLHAGQKVLIVGAGGLGLSAVQIAGLMGLRAAVADINPASLELASSLGAEWLINSGQTDPAAACRDITSGYGFDAVLEGVGYAGTMAWSLKSLKKDGTCIIMGYDPVNPVPVELINIHNNQWRIVGTKVSTRNGLREAVELVENGRIQPQIHETIALDQVNEALAALKRGGRTGRTVITSFGAT